MPYRYGGAVYWRTRVRVYERSGYKCVDCGLQFPTPTEPPTNGACPSLSTYDPTRSRLRICQLEIDHIMPVKHGGRSNEANLQALCTQCNQRKAAKRA